MGMMERVRDWFAPSRPRSVTPPSTRADFMRGNRGVVFGGWRPALREAADDVGSSWDLAAARTIDLIQNSGWMAGAIDQAVANTVGTGLRLKAMPENDLFGMSNADAEAWAQTVEQRWSLWADKAYECDIEGRRSFGLLQAAAFRSWFATGEIWAELPWRERPGGRYGTKVRLVLRGQHTTMTIVTDYADPCAVLPRIREAYYALLEGRRPELIEFDAGNGVRRKVQYGKTDLGALRSELGRLESYCGRTGGQRRRFGLRAGGL